MNRAAIIGSLDREVMKRISAYVAFAAPLLLGLVVFLLTAPFDPDPHHDGFQFAVATGIADGFYLYRDVFDQYGPVTAWLQGLELHLFGGQLLVLRVGNALVLAVTAGLLAVLLRRHIQSTVLAVAVASTWVMASPDWSVYPGLFSAWPWPSAVLGLVTLVCLLSLERGLRGQKKWLFAAGFAAAVALFTRWPQGVLIILVSILILLVFRDSCGSRSRSITSWLAGLISFTMAAGGYLFYQGSFADMVFQTVIEPMSIYSLGSDLNFVVLYYGYGSVAAAVVIGSAFVFISTTSQDGLRSRVTVARLSLFVISGAMFLCLVGALLFVGFGSLGLASTPFDPVLKDYQGAIDVLAMSPLLLAAALTPLFFLIFIARKVIRRVQLRGYPELAPPRMVLACFALLSLAQLYPIADVYHLWWAVPIPLAYVVTAAFGQFGRLRALSGPVFAVALIPFLVLGFIRFDRELALPRSEINNSALAGMYVSVDRLSAVDGVTQVLSSYRGNQVDYYCRDGLVSAWFGRFQSSTPAFVDWAWLKSAPVMRAQVSVICAADRREADGVAAYRDSHVISQAPFILNLSEFSAFQLFVAERNR